MVALAEVERANLRVRWGDGRLGAEMARRALDRFRRISDPTGAAQAIRVLGLAALAEGRRDEAAQRLDEALEIADAHADALLRAEVQRDRGVLLRTSGDPGGARRAFELAAAEYETIGSIAEATAIRILVAEL